ncbi:MAG: hypothetical protein GKR95_10665 [Gammaproteobacteria bacterium]|nr:hypothetical protein [Gammaproteobacteria bacterium]
MHIRKIFISILLLFPLVLQAQNGNDSKTVTVVTPIYDQKVSLHIPSTWKQGFEDLKADHYMIEFIPQNETIKKWENMISVQGFKGIAAKSTPEKFLNRLASRFQNLCGKNLVYLKGGSGQISGFASSAAIIGCSNVEEDHSTGLKKGQGELGMYYAIRGMNDLYLVHKAIRGDSANVSLNGENVGDFITPILPIKLCKKGGPRTECLN